MSLNLKPLKKFGQNFLKDKKYLDLIVDSAEIGNKDVVLEIGPGSGFLTERILKKSENLILVEKDKRFIEYLNKKFFGYKKMSIINQDILEFSPPEFNLRKDSYTVIGNIPYYLTSRLFKVIFESWPAPKRVIFTIQKEVAQRIISIPPNMSILSVAIQYFAKPEIVSLVPKTAFSPVPKVDSAILKLTPRDIVESEEEKNKFFKVVRAGFAYKRKVLINTLAEKINLDKENLESIFKNLHLSLNTRPQELTIDNWTNLSRKIVVDN
ncbi:MAG: ribosomal RNA small subunit methyltransferase A [Parcubacteria group bacterium]|nr:ribosomal RNA small subunit methyltransferase A [Parcubacteria group bacterium]